MQATERGLLPRSITYASLGSGLLLGDLEVIMALQEAGFTIESAAFVDTDYETNCRGALAEVANYLAPAKLVAYRSAAEFALARLRGRQRSAHVVCQIDADDISFGEAVAFSTFALGDEGGGIAFRLVNRHHETLVPMVSWHRVQTPSRPLAAALAHFEAECKEAGTQLVPAAAYRRILELVDPVPMIEVDKDPVAIGERR